MKLTVTSQQRAGLALLFAQNWSASDIDALVALDRAFGALQMAPAMQILRFGPGGMTIDEHVSLPDVEAELSEEDARLLLRVYPTTPTPWMLGRAKARLLLAMREALTRPEE